MKLKVYICQVVNNRVMKKKDYGIDRRNFIKLAGMASGGLLLGGAAGAGLSAGSNKDSYTGWGRTA